MHAHLWRSGLLAVPLLLAGCAGADGTPHAAAAGPSSPATQAAPPSATAAMIYGDDVTGDVARALSLPAPPPTTSTWADQLFTCHYPLPMDPLTLSVEQSPDPAAAARFFDRSAGSSGRRRPPSASASARTRRRPAPWS